ncbi:fumarate/nitrate reduction transcriptional regulator Fnr [Thiohalobacter sp. IOR34]|uniref:fumarate/nitrate reduction transcriptional regulator Fnr n=1 Tax=Thiohalobacter sp. IOR34 TaxID=3057176 RepID=UPI0025AEE167|nr:fumarate/nitrate reduction transcriptional regulator Fnr [Thiohalobacter sp. IOR34]WJW75640.1 fumarate/nitrate reduction transcriptional regulator Fnr [Thiohalobacter sp. IOR34]
MSASNPKVISLSNIKTACESCSLHQLCLPLELAHDDIEALDRIIKQRKPLHRGDYLFQMGDPFRAIYAVRSGSIKTFTSSGNGDEQVTGFHLPSEIVGLDAITSHRHPCSARALETTSVCEIPFDQLEALGNRIPGLQRQLLRIMSREILEDQNMMIWLGKKSAEERLAALLLRISQRFQERKFSALEFNLSMSRTDIANYLGLAVETVSRLFSRFQQEGLLNVDRKHLIIHDLDGLQRMAGIDPARHPRSS